MLSYLCVTPSLRYNTADVLRLILRRRKVLTSKRVGSAYFYNRALVERGTEP